MYVDCVQYTVQYCILGFCYLICVLKTIRDLVTVSLPLTIPLLTIEMLTVKINMKESFHAVDLHKNVGWLSMSFKEKILHFYYSTSVYSLV